MFKMLDRLLVIFILILLLVSCKGFGEVKQPAKRPELKDLYNSLKNHAQTVHTVQADGKIEYKKQGKDARHDRGSFTWVVKKPKQATFEITGPTGLLAVVGIGEEEFRYYDAREQRLFFGPVEGDALERVLPWGISPKDLIPLLCASPRLIKADSSAIEYDKKVKRWRLILHNSRSDKIQLLWFNADLTLYRSKLLRRKYTYWDVTYLGWERRDESGINFPGYIKLQHPATKTTITLKAHGDPDINKQIDDSVFLLNFPESIPVERL